MSTVTARLTSRFRGSFAAAGAIALVASCLAYAQGAESTLSLLNTRGISFGAFAAPTGGGVVISPAGTRSSIGGVVLISASEGAAAQFTISGDPDFMYSITLPSDGTVALDDGAGHTMEVNGFTSNPALSGQLSAGGTQALAIGATLNVSANQPAGSYSGDFPVTVNYE